MISDNNILKGCCHRSDRDERNEMFFYSLPGGIGFEFKMFVKSATTLEVIATELDGTVQLDTMCRDMQKRINDGNNGIRIGDVFGKIRDVGYYYNEITEKGGGFAYIEGVVMSDENHGTAQCWKQLKQTISSKFTFVYFEVLNPVIACVI